MGDIIAAGNAGTQAGFTSHVGIFLGGGLYVSQSPSGYPSQATGDGAGTTSEIKMRPIDQFKDWPKTNYRDTSKACQ